MSQLITLEIVTPDGAKLSTEVSELTAPSVEGEFGVMPGHRPLMAALAAGLVRYRAGGELHEVAVGPGFVELHDDKATLLTDRYLEKGSVDPVVARLELKEADEAIERFDGDPSSAEYQLLVEREVWAAVQLELYGDPPPPMVRLGQFRVVQDTSVNEGIEPARMADDDSAPADGAH